VQAAEPASVSPFVVDASRDWAFHPDPKDAGLGSKWHHPRYNDAKWERLAEPWMGATAAPPPGRRKKAEGKIWFRKWLDIPAGSPPRLFLSVSMAGDVDVFVNGMWLGKGLKGGESHVVEATAAAAGERFLVALRLKKPSDGAAPGGLVSAVFSPDSRALFGPVSAWLEFLARSAPGLGWPGYLSGRASVRVAAGLPARGPVFQVGAEGQMVPPGAPFIVSCWVYDRAAKKLLTPEAVPCQVSLDERLLAVPVVLARLGRYNLYLRFWAEELEGKPGVMVAMGEVTLQNGSDRTRNVDLLIAVHPLLPWGGEPGGGVARIETVEHDASSRTILVNGRPAVVLTAPADRFVAAPFAEGTVARGFAETESAYADRAADPGMKMASGAAVYGLKIQPFGARTRTFRVFIAGTPERVTPEYTQGMREESAKWSYRDARNLWRKLLVGRDRFYLRIPDKRAQDAFYAGIGCLLSGGGAGKPASAAEALEKTGHPEAAALVRASHPVSASSFAELVAAGGGGQVRPAAEFARARSLLRAGDAAGVEQLLTGGVKHMAAPGAFAWGEIADSRSGRWVGGGMPDLLSTASFILLVRDIIVREEGDSLALVPALPPSWLRPGSFIEAKNVPTSFGTLGYSLAVRSGGLALNFTQTPTAPGGCRWCIPGRKGIGKVVVDGKRADVPESRCLALPVGTRKAAVSWR